MKSSIYPEESESDIIEFLIDSARSGEATDVADIEQILDDNVNFINSRNEFGQSMLHYACANGNARILDLLLSDKYKSAIDINIQNIEGNTPLHWAAVNNQFDTLKKLLDVGCDCAVKNLAGQNALQEIQDKGFEEIELLLLAKDKDLDEFIRTCEEIADGADNIDSSSMSEDSNVDPCEE